MPTLTRCLVANRGEIAVRVMRACAERGMSTVAVASDADARAPHTLLADAVVRLPGHAPAGTYLNADALIRAALQTGCDCVHPGYGFLSENAGFAQAVIDAGLVWVGPPPEAMAAMGVKTEARARMRAAGVPLVPGYQGERGDDDDAYLRAAPSVGYPLLVKAAGGGGGRGMRIVHERDALPDALAAARREAEAAFGDARVFLEHYIARARHVEVQVLADAHGHVLALFERECSAQRRHQKIVEEAPSPALTPAMRAAMMQAAVSAARAVGYVNAGTAEFIVTPDGDFYFLEMNTRLQVEHPVTELVTGLDLVHLQFQVAAGLPLALTQDEVRLRGHAIEVRLYAEDPANSFLPSTGTLHTCVFPAGPGVRVDSGVAAGDEVTMHYDPLLAKIIVYAPTRALALARLGRALRETVVLGVTTNLAFLRALVAHPVFVAGDVTTSFVDARAADLVPPTPSLLPDAAWAALALAAQQSTPAAHGATHDANADVHSPWAHTDGWRV